MADDTERRLRDALRDASLPQAPESLRVAVQAVVARPPVATPHGRLWPRVLPAVAAVAAVALVVVVATGGFGRLATTASSASPSSVAPSATPEPTEPVATQVVAGPPAPPTSVRVLTAVQLYAEITATRAGTIAAHDVVANVAAIQMEGGVEACAEPAGTCTQVAVLDGFGPAGVITVRTEDAVLPPPLAADDLKAPLALRLVPGGAIELLGHVDLAGGSGAVDLERLRSQTAATPAGRVVAVLAWLQGSELATLCPASAGAVEPFICPGTGSFLTPNGSSIATSLHVGEADGYRRFAPSPLVDGAVGVPRLGMYLVRMVAVDTAGCPACRGWLLVGRLDATARVAASGSPLPTGGPQVYTTADLETVLSADRAAWVGRAVIVSGGVSAAPVGDSCDVIVPTLSLAPRLCAFGRLDGTIEDLWASPYTITLASLGSGPPFTGTFALRVLPAGLEYLGPMGTGGTGDVTATLDDLTTLAAGPPQGPVVLVVSAWLGTSGPLPCPSAPGSAPPPDTPFGTGCPTSWLAPSNEGADFSVPTGSVPVQYGAYHDFAPGATADSRDPKFGTYVVRLVTDTRQGTDGPLGWQVVGRFSP